MPILPRWISGPAHPTFLSRGTCVLLSLVIFLSSVLPTLAGTFVAFGPQSYIRATGDPVTVTKTFALLNPSTTYTLQINNGGLVDGSFEKVSTSVFTLNGIQVVGPNEFNQNVTVLQKPVLLSGQNTLDVEVRGKPGGGLAVQVIGVDNDPPTITASISPPPNAPGWNNADVAVTFTCADSMSGIADCPAPIPVQTEGAGQVVSGTATDKAGNTATVSVSVNLDKTPPRVQITSPANGATLTSSPTTVTANVSDDLSGLSDVTCNGASASLSNSTFACSVSLNEGTNAIVVQATDRAGNTGSSANTVAFRAAPPPPSVSITSPGDGATITQSPVLVRGTLTSASPNGTQADVGIVVNGRIAHVSGTQFAADGIELQEGSNTVTATAADASGQTGSATIHVTFTPGIPATPQVRLTASAPNTLAPAAVTFSATTSLANPVVSYQMDFEGDGVVDTNTPAFVNAAHTYTTLGLYFPALTVTDTQGNTFIGTTVVNILSASELDPLLQSKWNGMKATLDAGNIDGAMGFLTPGARSRYRRAFVGLGGDLPQIVSTLPPIELLEAGPTSARYVISRYQAGKNRSYFIEFGRDAQGLWKIQAF